MIKFLKTLRERKPSENQSDLIDFIEQVEYQRIKSLPRYQPTDTILFGNAFKIVDSSTYLGGMREIFKKRIYEFNSNTKSPLIIDCGANIGLSVLFFKKLFPDAKVMAFEADPNIFEVCKYNLQNQGCFTNVELYQKAVWVHNDSIPFAIEGGFSGRIPMPEDENNIAEVAAVRLKDILQANNSVEFLKIDIEGAEDEVLKDCADHLHGVENIFVEYHSHSSKPQTLDELLSIFKSAGFRYHIQEAFVRTKPYINRQTMLGMDLQLNIYGYRK